MRPKLHSLALALALALAAPLLAAVTVNAAAAEQSASNRAQLVMLDEKGCYWCEQWTHDIGGIYAKTVEGQRAPLRRLSIHDRLPDDLAYLAKGSYTPTFVLVADGREIGRIRGYPGPDFFWPLLGQLLDKLPSSEENSIRPD